MRIHWYLPTKTSEISDLQNSNLASIRLRALPSIRGLQKKGLEVSHGEQNNPDKRLNVAIFGKLGDPIDVANRTIKWTEEIKKLKAQGVIIVIDYTDHHLLINSNMTRFYVDNINLADIVTVPSPKMIESLENLTKSKIVLINDAIEFDVIYPVKKNNIIKEVLWFGSKSNLKYLVEYLEKIELCSELNINVLIDKKGMQWLSATELKNKTKINIKSNIWSRVELVEVAKKCDFCIIPSDISDVRKSGAGANRLITSLALGLPVLATNLSSYKPYDEYYLDIEKNNIKKMIRNLDHMQNIVIQAQRNIIEEFTIEAIGEKWYESIIN